MSHLSRKKEQTQRALLEAVHCCLQEKAFNHISTVDITKAAQISRSNFYNYFRDKYDLIDFYQRQLSRDLESVFANYGTDKRGTFIAIIRYIQQEDLLADLLSSHGTHEIHNHFINKIRIMLDHTLLPQISKDIPDGLTREYSSIYFAHAFFAIIQHWILTGKQETPEELADLIMLVLPNL